MRELLGEISRMKPRAFAAGMAIGLMLSLAGWQGLVPRLVLDGVLVTVWLVFVGYFILKLLGRHGGSPS